jgi:hypothetical protein
MGKRDKGMEQLKICDSENQVNLEQRLKTGFSHN